MWRPAPRWSLRGLGAPAFWPVDALVVLGMGAALVHAWDVLATMTPPEYSAIRPYLGASSGFQSWQYRCVEFMLGNKNAAMLKPHSHRPEILAKVEAALREELASFRSDQENA